jgi:hypothetical protein
MTQIEKMKFAEGVRGVLTGEVQGVLRGCCTSESNLEHDSGGLFFNVDERRVRDSSRHVDIHFD